MTMDDAGAIVSFCIGISSLCVFFSLFCCILSAQLAVFFFAALFLCLSFGFSFFLKQFSSFEDILMKDISGKKEKEISTNTRESITFQHRFQLPPRKKTCELVKDRIKENQKKKKKKKKIF